MTGVIYARYSEGPRQTEQSIEGQVDDCRAYAEEKGISIIGIYADRHISGKSVDGRDEFQRMMLDAQAHRFDAVIVWKVDRFGRNREDIAVNKMKLRKAGVHLLYARESLPDGPEGILLESLLEGLAEYYSADLRQKVIRGHAESAKKGKWTAGSLPIGYKKDEEQRIVVDQERAPLVREIFRMHIAGAKLSEMQDYLFAHGVNSRYGKRPVAAVVERMLRNRAYLGEFAFQGIPIPADPIIDGATFDEAQRHFRGSKHNAAGKAKVAYLLSCKCVCGCCGSLLHGESGRGKKGKVYHYYKCAGVKKKICSLKPMPQKTLEDLVVEKTISDVLTDELIGKLTKKIMEVQRKRREADPAEELRKRLAANRRKQANLVAAIEEGGARALAARLTELEAEEDDLSLRIRKAELVRPEIPESTIRAWLESFRSGDKDDPAFCQKLVQTFVAQVVVTPEHVVIFYNIEKEPYPKSSDTAPRLDLAERYPNFSGPVVIDGYIMLRVAV